MNILIVEDEFLIALDLQMQLEQLQHSVLGPVKDFAACREVVTQSRPDLAFMDLRLANGESGEDLAQWLLSEYSIRCIFWTSAAALELKGLKPSSCKVPHRGMPPYNPV